jgi:DNA-binding CsgD family transcriptional regulator/PAS domain-containing protein
MDRFVGEQLPALLELLYDAALDHSRWQAFLDALTPCFGGATGIMYGFDGTRGVMDFTYNFGTDPAFIRSYAQYYGRLNPYPNLALSLLPGKVAMAQAALDTATLRRTAFFNDWMRPQDIPAEHFGMVVHKHGSRGVVLGVAPRAALFKRNQHLYRRQLELLMPHMARVAEFNRIAAVGRQTERVLGAALDALAASAFLIDRAGRIVLANQRGEALIRSQRAVSVSPCGKVRAVGPQGNHALQAALAMAVQRRTSAPLRLVCPHSGRQFIAWVVPTHAPRATQTNGDGGLLVDSFEQTATALLLVTPVDRSATTPAEAIAAAFQLSPAEARLVSALCAGLTLAEYAGQAELSRNTVRNQLACVFAKTRTSRQSELVSRVVAALGCAPSGLADSDRRNGTQAFHSMRGSA